MRMRLHSNCEMKHQDLFKYEPDAAKLSRSQRLLRASFYSNCNQETECPHL